MQGAADVAGLAGTGIVARPLAASRPRRRGRSACQLLNVEENMVEEQVQGLTSLQNAVEVN